MSHAKRRTMRRLARDGKCPICTNGIEGMTKQCPKCRLVYHPSCWQKRCSLPGCVTAAPALRKPRMAMAVSLSLPCSDSRTRPEQLRPAYLDPDLVDLQLRRGLNQWVVDGDRLTGVEMAIVCFVLICMVGPFVIAAFHPMKGQPVQEAKPQ